MGGPLIIPVRRKKELVSKKPNQLVHTYAKQLHFRSKHKCLFMFSRCQSKTQELHPLFVIHIDLVFFVFTTPSLSGRWFTELKQLLPRREDGRPDSGTAERIGYFRVATRTNATRVDRDSNPTVSRANG